MNLREARNRRDIGGKLDSWSVGVHADDATSSNVGVDADAPLCKSLAMIRLRPHIGWYRPRALPHFDTPERPQFVTFRLCDSLPERFFLTNKEQTSFGLRRRIHDALDGGVGACWLARPELAEIVRDALVHGCGRTHDMHAFVVMPNHVHVLTSFRERNRLCDVVRGWKSYSARQINAILGREGMLWQREYFDRYIRDEKHFERVRAYIENNPVRAGLTQEAGEWRFSSAHSGASASTPKSSVISPQESYTP